MQKKYFFRNHFSAFALLLITFVFLLSGYRNHSRTELPDCKKLLLQMLDSMENVSSMRFHMKADERIKGKIMHYGSKGKFIKKPKKIYVSAGAAEVLWKEGVNNGNALVNPGGFPYFNLNLDPMGALMRDGQHHTIFEIGFDYFGGVIQKSMKTAETNFSKYFKLVGSTTWNSRDCWLVTIEYPEFAYLDYTVKKGENILKIARALQVGEFMILDRNAGKVKDFYDVKAGQVIKVPNAYARKTSIMIDKKLMLPINTKVYDEKGLFESYEYHSIEVNVKISDEEFSKDYKDYKF